MRLLALFIKDLTEIVRDRRAAVFLVLMPLLFTLIFGLFFSGPKGDRRLPVGWWSDEKEDPLSAGLREVLSSSDSIRVVRLNPKDMKRMDRLVRDDKLAAALLVPDKFGLAVREDRNKEKIKLTIIADSGKPAAQAAIAAIQSSYKRFLGALEAGRLSLELVEKKQPFADAASREAFFMESLALALAAWKKPSLTVNVESAAPPHPEDKTKVTGGFAQSSPGMLVQFAIYGLINSAMVLVLERKSKVLRRLLAAPIRRAEIIAGHTLSMFAVCFLQQVILVVFGQFGLGVDYLREPVGLLMMMVSLALWAACLGLFIGAISKAEDRVVMFSLIAMFVFSALGGAWFPLEVAGKSFARIGHLMPTAWAMDGFQNIVVRGQGFASTLLPAGILLAFSGFFFSLAIWRFRFE